MFVSNNRPLIYLLVKGNLVKHQKVSKYYEIDCLQNFILFFMLLLTTKFVKTSHTRDRTFFILMKDVLKQT